MLFLKLLIALIWLGCVEANDLLKFLVDFTLLENTGRIRVCNFINCWGFDNLRLVKEASSNFRCSISVHHPSTPIGNWFVDFHLQLFVLDLSCPGTEEFLKQAEGLGLFNGNFVWLMFNSKESPGHLPAANGTESRDMFQNLYFTAISQIHIANRVQHDKFELMGMYRRDVKSIMIEENLGYWTSDEGLVFTAVAIPSVRRIDLHGHFFKGVMIITDDDSLNHMDDMINPEVDNMAKTSKVLYDYVIQGLNASIEYKIVREWGEKVNGTFNGMVGYVHRNEAQLVVSPLLMSPTRMEVLKYVGITYNTRATFIFLSPPLSYQHNIYVLPFSMYIWYCTMVLFATSLLFLRIGASYDTESDLLDRPQPAKAASKSLSDMIMLLVATLCQQDSNMEPRGICGRVVMLNIKVAALFLYVSYSAAILVLLQSSDRSITDLKLLDKSNLELGGLDVPYNRFYLQFQPGLDPVRAAITKKVSHVNGFLSMEEGIEKVRTGLFAFHAEKSSLYHAILRMFDETEKCRFQELQESFLVDSDTLVAVKKHLPYAEVFTIMFKRIHEWGLLRRVEYRINAKMPRCSKNNVAYISIGLVNCQAAFYLLSWGILLAISIVFIEILYFKLKRSKRGRRSPNVMPLDIGFYD